MSIKPLPPDPYAPEWYSPLPSFVERKNGWARYVRMVIEDEDFSGKDLSQTEFDSCKIYQSTFDRAYGDYFTLRGCLVYDSSFAYVQFNKERLGVTHNLFWNSCGALGLATMPVKYSNGNVVLQGDKVLLDQQGGSE